MTLCEFLFLIRQVSEASARVRQAATSAENADEFRLMLARLRAASASLSESSCGNESASDIAEALRVLGEAKQVLAGFADR